MFFSPFVSSTSTNGSYDFSYTTACTTKLDIYPYYISTALKMNITWTNAGVGQDVFVYANYPLPN